ncbi:MAG: hypothetical protein ACRDKY_09665 [Solirubrobacteraceae bacterium]
MRPSDQLDRYRDLLDEQGVTLRAGRRGAYEGAGTDARTAWEVFVGAAAERTGDEDGELAFESAVSQASSTYVLAFVRRIGRRGLHLIIEFEATPRVTHLAFAEHRGSAGSAERWAAEVEDMQAFALPFAMQPPLLFVVQEGRVR